MEAYWCDACKDVREFTECSEIGYIWDFAKHRAAGDKTHTDLPTSWACQKIAYSCINTNCKKYGVCLPAPGACDECSDDITSKRFGLGHYLNVQSVVKKAQNLVKVSRL